MVQVGPYQFKVRAEKAGPAIGLVRQQTGLSQNKARKLFDLGKVYLEGAPCLDWRTPVESGQEVSVDTDRRRPGRMVQVAPDCVVYQDHSIVVVNKPHSIVSVPPTPTGEPTLMDRVSSLLGVPLLPLHRLDRDTSGLMVFGIRGATLDPLRKQFSNHLARRLYYAVVQGCARDCTLAGDIDVTRPGRGGPPLIRRAVTHVETVRLADQITLVRCIPETGRWHPIRIQLAQAGWPIVGETLHLPPGVPPASGRSLLALQSYSLSLAHPGDGGQMQWELPLAQHLATLLG